MERLIDTNVILRYLLDDVPDMSAKAAIIISEGAFVLPEIIAEAVYVLDGVYDVPKKEICNALTSLLDEVSISNKAVIIKALDIFAKHNLDFVDCIIVARSKILGESVFSFDKKLNSLL